MVPILVEEIYAFIAKYDAVIAYTAEGRLQVKHSLSVLETRLNPEYFARVHRGIIVNLAFITEIEHGATGVAMLRLKDGSIHRISHSYLSNLQKRLEC